MPGDGPPTVNAPVSFRLGLPAAGALLLGVGTLLSLPVLPSSPVFAGGVALLVLGVWLSLRRPLPLRSGADLLVALVLFGFLWAGLHARHALEQRLPPGLAGQDLVVEGRVLGLVREGQASTGFDLRILRADGEPGLAGRRVRLGWYGDAPAIAPGETWRLQVRLKRPRGVVNRAGAAFERRALEQRLAATGYVREPASAQRLAPARGLDAWRSSISRRFRDELPSPGSRFVRGLAVGDTRGLADRDWDALRATGLTHLMAISGFHVGVMAGFGALLGRLAYRLLPALGRRLPAPQGAALSALVLAGAYAAAAGFALPTQRAVVMIAAALAAVLARRRTSPGQAFALALAAALLVDPLAVLSAGFWLSFLGVGWLLWCLSGARDDGVWRPLVRAQWVVTLGLLPLTAWFFGQASWVGPLANLVAIPLVTLVVVPLSFLGLGLELLAPGLGLAPAQWAALIAERGASAMQVLGGQPWAMRHLPAPSVAALALALAGVCWLLLPRGVGAKPLALVLLLPLAWPRPPALAPGEIELEVLDVGQGLSVVVRSRSQTLLVDTGPRFPGGLDLGASVVVPSLRAHRRPRLDRILISHGDSDHAGGLASVQRAFAAAPLIGPAPWIQGRADPTQPGPCLAGEGWRRDGIDYTFLHPPRYFPDAGNDGGCVLRIDGPFGSVLLTGDIGNVVERRLLRLYPDALAADVLLVGHHGSGSSSSAAFLAAVSPRLALVSSGHGNRFGHPHPDVVDRLGAVGARTLGTADHGALVVRIGPGGLRASARRCAGPRIWHEPRHRHCHEP